VTINAHNFVEIWNLAAPSTMLKRQFCEEECILYSGDFCQSTRLVASGTVFRTVLIWSIDSQGSHSPVKIKLEGHDGVIFDVRFLRKDLVASVSDDRSMRLWKLNLDSCTYAQLGEFYGHRSRIWKLRELDYQGMIATVCEDATCKIWEVPGDIEEKPHRGFNRSIETLKGHMGRNIRAITCY